MERESTYHRASLLTNRRSLSVTVHSHRIICPHRIALFVVWHRNIHILRSCTNDKNEKKKHPFYYVLPHFITPSRSNVIFMGLHSHDRPFFFHKKIKIFKILMLNLSKCSLQDDINGAKVLNTCVYIDTT